MAPLDGELWTERKQFQRTISIVRRQDPGDGWRAVRFVVFDAPAHDGFEKREPDGTRKFWEIEPDGSRHRVRFGVFEAKTKTFTDAAQAAAELEARIAEKLGRGFEEVP
jgi:predicted DNA-binding WGR domain protein